MAKKAPAQSVPKTQKKMYVLDTNVLVHDPSAIFNFEGVHIGIPSVVLEELDKFKKEGTDRGRNTREVIRHLDGLRAKGSLREGITLDNGGIVKVLFLTHDVPQMPFKLGVEDNEILLTALTQKEQGFTVKFISKDLNARVKADALGLETQDYLKEYVTEEEFYKGWVAVDVPAVQLKKDVPPILDELMHDYDIAVNQFVLVRSQHNPHNHRLFRYLDNKKYKEVQHPRIKWPLRARNTEQLMALDLLFDPAIEFVSLLGPAGTGKTFLAMLAGLEKVLLKSEYKCLPISRPVIPLGRDIGFLPGTIEEKMHSWMLPIYDNMEFIRHAVNTAKTHDLDDGQKGKKKKDKEKGRKGKATIPPLEELVHRGKISLEAITYMRGRSIPYQFIIIDEAQNLTPHEVKTLVSRVGEGSKIVLAGDPYQIDSPYLDFASNGLVVSSERFKGQKLFGSVFLQTSERSELSHLATKLL